MRRWCSSLRPVRHCIHYMNIGMFCSYPWILPTRRRPWHHSLYWHVLVYHGWLQPLHWVGPWDNMMRMGGGRSFIHYCLHPPRPRPQQRRSRWRTKCPTERVSCLWTNATVGVYHSLWIIRPIRHSIPWPKRNIHYSWHYWDPIAVLGFNFEIPWRRIRHPPPRSLNNSVNNRSRYGQHSPIATTTTTTTKRKMEILYWMIHRQCPWTVPPHHVNHDRDDCHGNGT